MYEDIHAKNTSVDSSPGVNDARVSNNLWTYHL